MQHNDVALTWRSAISDEELADLTAAHGGSPEIGWWDRVSQHSLGWVAGRDPQGALVGFVNVAWDGADHAFLIDTKTHPARQHQGLGTAVVRYAVEAVRSAGCEWLFVDYGEDMVPFYEKACGFAPTHAGLIHLR
ncbi:GNAT family N-acetyltransferase [Curtobacterium sp. NPDC089991]|uniref:GNAT family N-acetyltransferase n=1 Tax=Curtobacterium sp. NPDC089991 TaxID=3363969 RepID=UPI00381A2ECD